MVFLSSIHPKRTPIQKAIRIGIGVLGVAAIVYILSLVPYDILREERHRMYGEARTTGIITGVRTDDVAIAGSRFVAEYKFIDGDGYARQALAPLPRELWDKLQPGSKVQVLFVRPLPHLVRMVGEIEPPFQIWLRSVLR